MTYINTKRVDNLDLRYKIRSISITTILLIVMLILFSISSVFFATNVKRGIVPDEYLHSFLSNLFSTTWGTPPDTPETYSYGYLNHRPILYYWINGRLINVIRIFIPSLSNWRLLVSLRLINVTYSIFSIFFCYLLSLEITKSRWWSLLVVFLLTNTLMFVFLSGGVNYDNLTNLCSFAGIYFLVRVLNHKSFYLNSLLWWIFILTGALVKISVLPLFVIMATVWALFIVKNRNKINFRPLFDWKTISLLPVFFALIYLNFSLYGVNIVRYKSLSPACEKILTQEQCNLNPVIRRAQRIYLPSKITYADIVKGGNPDPIEWFLDFWVNNVLKMIFGIAGHISYYPDLVITFHRFLIILVMFIAIRSWNKYTYPFYSLIAIYIFYIIVLLYTNYDSELITGFKHIGMQGRYVFPVIGIGYVMTVFFISGAQNMIIRRATTAFTLVLFLWSSPFSLLFAKVPTTYPEPVIQPGALMGEIVGGVELSQDFKSQCANDIDQVSLLFNGFHRVNTHPIIFRLVDTLKNKVIYEQTIRGEAIIDDIWLSFNFPPQPATINSIYRISITSPGSVPGNAVTLWSTSGDALPGSELLVNGAPTGRDLVFRYECMQPALTGWFYSSNEAAQ